MKDYLVKFKKTVQVTEDSWDYVTIEKLFDSTSTIGEINTWFSNNTKGNHDPNRLNVILSEPEPKNPTNHE